MKKDTNYLTVASIFQSHMVIQRDKPIVIWGNAPDLSNITVNFCGSTYTAAVTDQKWRCVLPSMDAGEGYTITISCSHEDTSPIILEGISIGDIWLACGQSNMEFHLRYDEDWENVRNYEKNSKIHMYNVPQLAFEGHKKDTKGYGIWFYEGECGFETFSAPGYSFARHVQPHINVPIGIIGCNWGGSTASAWLEEDYLSREPLSVYLKEYEEAIKDISLEELKKRSMEAYAFEESQKHAEDFMPLMYGRDEKWQQEYMKEHENDAFVPMGPWNINRPSGLYHQMLEPLIPFSIKGVLWYQGESDAAHADIYDKLFSSLIDCWRRKWKDNFPFLFVQLAPFKKWLACDATGYPEVRQKQEIVSKTVTNTAMASIMDIGSYYDIHPKKKMEVGRRLALLARGKVYGENILCESPELEKAERKDNQIILSFLHCGQSGDKSGLYIMDKTYNSIMADNHDVNGFLIMQNNEKIPIDSIEIKGNHILLNFKDLKDTPCTIFFAWEEYVEVNVFNAAGLPLKPFECTI
ncbi:MAG: sialate O-acetylesterase [Clostridiales bacterium]|nr:sialate O-acetylesterase [Clostridiales bacterium]